MSKLERLLQEWVAQKLITSDQAGQIQKFESSKAQTSWVMSGLLILGAIIVGIGVVSLIAANWANIPDALKLAIDFAILFALGAAAVSAERNGKVAVFEVLLVSLQLLVLASIGLISQIYHTGGKLHQALFFWSLVTLSLALISKRFFVPFLWSGVFMAAVTMVGLESERVRSIFDRGAEAIFALNPFFAAVAAGALARIQSARGPLFTPTDGLICAFRWWILWSGLIVLLIFEFASGLSRYEASQGILGLLCGFAFVIAVDVSTSREFRNIQKGLLLGVLVAFVVACWVTTGPRSSLVQGIATICVLMTSGIFLASVQARGLFQFMISLVGLRFLVLYFQAFGGLATTGFGLILSGIFVIGSVVIWNKYLTRLTTWVEGWTR